ncbi:hypothetical protein ADL35_11700, partial [Streptomyces sp. NRRL WC-3753]
MTTTDRDRAALRAEDTPEEPRSEVVALDAESGRELWSAPTGAQSTAVTGRNQDAVVSGSAVLMVDAANSRLEARNARSGEVTRLGSTPD